MVPASSMTPAQSKSPRAVQVAARAPTWNRGRAEMAHLAAQELIQSNSPLAAYVK